MMWNLGIVLKLFSRINANDETNQIRMMKSDSVKKKTN